MTDSSEQLSPRAQARLARRLLRRSKKRLAETRYREIEESILAVEQARKKDDETRLREAVEQLQKHIDGPLAPARKSPTREVIESVFVAVLIALCIRAFFFELFKIPSPSMVPTLLVGDRLVVEKFAYGIRVPFSTSYLAMWDRPQRGEVVVFEFPRLHAQTRHVMGPVIAQLDALPAGERPETLAAIQPVAAHSNLRADAWGTPFRYEPAADPYVFTSAGPDGTFGTNDDITAEQVRASFLMRGSQTNGQIGVPCPVDAASLQQRGRTYIKRVIGEPGDVVELVDNRLVINGERQPVTDPRTRTEQVAGGMMLPTYGDESLTGDGTHQIRYFRENRSFGPIEVPEDHYLMLGDNRDESSDGRCWGFVPTEHVKGRATRIAFSTSKTANKGLFEAIPALFERTGQRIR